MRSGTGRRKTTPKSADSVPAQESSGNVFQDLGIADSEQALARADLAGRIVALISERGITQTAAAKLLGIDQPGVSDLVRGKLKRYSTDRLLRFLGALGQDVEIRVRSARSENPSFSVVTERRRTSPSAVKRTKAGATRPRKAS